MEEEYLEFAKDIAKEAGKIINCLKSPPKIFDKVKDIWYYLITKQMNL